MARRWQVLAVSSVAMFLVFLVLTTLNVALPDVERSFPESSRAGLSWVLTSYNIVFAALLIPAGRLADRYGRRRFFLAGLLLFVVSSALCAAAPSLGALIVARVLQAAASAVLMPVSLTLVLHEFPPERRSTAVALWGSAGAVASACGPPLGGVLVEIADWRWTFLVNEPVGLAAWAWGGRVLRECRDPNPGPFPDPLGIAVLAGAAALLILGVLQGSGWGWADARTVGALACAALLAPLLVRRTMRHPAPVVEPALLRVRSFNVANASGFLFSAAFFAYSLCNALFLTSVWGYTTLAAGLALVPSALTAAVASVLAGCLADRYGHRAVAAPGAVVFALGAAWYAFAIGNEPAFLSGWLPGAVLGGAGIGLSLPVLIGAAVEFLPPARSASGSAANATVRQIGAALGVAALVALVGDPPPAEAPAAFDRGYLFVAAGGLLAAASLLLGHTRKPAKACGDGSTPTRAPA